MYRQAYLSILLAVGFLVLQCDGASAQQNWAKELFVETQHDFGAVSRGSMAEFHFDFKNTLDKDLLITKLQTSCGCTQPSIAKGRIAPGESGTVVAKFNTTSFTGQKSAVVTVVFAEPQQAEVQLNVSGFIRTDVVVEPAEVNFGSFRDGDAKPVTLKISYTGSGAWQIQDVRSQFSQLQVSLQRRENTGRGISYEMKVGLKKDSPVGEFRERMTLITNEEKNPTIALDVIGRVEPDLILTPASLNLGSVPKGGMVSKRLVLRGPEAFEVKDIKCKDLRFQFTKPEGKKALHFVNVQFSSGQVPGKIFESIEIQTDLNGGNSATCPVSGEVM
ncbi:hypothetical protein Poly24_12460 [Rosistilla carotiformis]|uniref:DUF1573 domain-containing protein n=1 Tax=Rosistilla carotiformis TaxID=2528017 RepID=A0A518JPS2_9BACT|nr:DUF1573 domain-containing protein [Rosistilla carotiformis]QDV67546.1 hypothetical protein Poly24_12460 [Rosistilla carotiformis]